MPTTLLAKIILKSSSSLNKIANFHHQGALLFFNSKISLRLSIVLSESQNTSQHIKASNLI